MKYNEMQVEVRKISEKVKQGRSITQGELDLMRRNAQAAGTLQSRVEYVTAKRHLLIEDNEEDKGE
jgi:hypothetical protein